MIKDDNGNYICESCGKKLELNGLYDAYFCKSCDMWAENKCNDEYCEFCADRLDRPSEV